MKFSSILSLTSLASAAPYFHSNEGSPDALSVKLEMVGNSDVKASITNNGNAKLRLLRTGTILGNTPVEKVQVTQNDQELAFGGVHLTIAYDMLENGAFQDIDAGQTAEVTFDVAQIRDLSRGGKFDISATGSIPFANEGSNTLAGAVSYASNRIQADVDGQKASLSRLVLDQKRTVVKPDCTGSNYTIVRAALRNCANLAQAATQAATFGPDARMQQFYQATDKTTRGIVAGVFEKVKNECLSFDGGVSSLYCSDRFNSCAEGVLAYTVAQASYMVYCNLYLTRLPLNSQSCYGQSQSNTIVHEVTHLSQVKGTNDYGGYGISSVQNLTAAQNINHADTYALFAQSTFAGC
ncbi:unnamed protein product [Clonostachys byssicola]|uniref:Neutral protease 2 n=1 Tax=Clonostachys byssicola TaxID=160290 RepID=A0A9N9Y244_9HYPO|nr:unnamed protein product [Clonostachys byssicola]